MNKLLPETLKNCPFCGNPPTQVDNYSPHFYRCNICIDEDGCISEEIWNSRALDPRLKEAIKEIDNWIDEIPSGKDAYKDGQRAGLSGALYYIIENIPEVKDE